MFVRRAVLVFKVLTKYFMTTPETVTLSEGFNSGSMKGRNLCFGNKIY